MDEHCKKSMACSFLDSFRVSEGMEADAEARKHASKFADFVIQELIPGILGPDREEWFDRFNGRTFSNKSFGGSGYAFDITGLPGVEDPSVSLMLLLIPGRKGIGTGGFAVSDNGIPYLSLHGFKGRKGAGGLKVLSLKSLATDLDRETVEHEYQHFLDSRRVKNPELFKVGDEKVRKEGYYEDPLEYNAFFQEAVSAFTQLLDSKKYSPSFLIPKKFSTFVGMFVIYTDFPWHEVPDKYKRKTVKRLYQVWQDLYQKYLGGES